METLTQITPSFWIGAKVVILVFLGIYVAFSVVIVKQAKLMAETLDVEFDYVIVVVSYLHLIAAMLVFLASLVLL